MFTQRRKIEWKDEKHFILWLLLREYSEEAIKELQKGEVVEDVEELLAAPIYDEKIRERIRYIFDMIMKDDEKGKEQNAQGLYENRVINEIPVNSQEVFYQDAYDRCVKEV